MVTLSPAKFWTYFGINLLIWKVLELELFRFLDLSWEDEFNWLVALRMTYALKLERLVFF